MRTFFTLICLLTAVFSQASSADETLLAQVKAKISAMPSMDVIFAINGGNNVVEGSATIAADRYHMSTPALKVWYDGHTQWTYLVNNKELSISEPDITDLTTSNPFVILSSPSTNYNIRRLGDAKGEARIELVPKTPMGGLASIIVRVNVATKLPTAILLTFDDNRRVEVNIQRITSGIKLPAEAFKYDKKKYPANEIVDLR